MNYEYGDEIKLTTGASSIRAVVLDGKPTIAQRLKLAWRILRGVK